MKDTTKLFFILNIHILPLLLLIEWPFSERPITKKRLQIYYEYIAASPQQVRLLLCSDLLNTNSRVSNNNFISSFIFRERLLDMDRFLWKNYLSKVNTKVKLLSEKPKSSNIPSETTKYSGYTPVSQTSPSLPSSTQTGFTVNTQEAPRSPLVHSYHTFNSSREILREKKNGNDEVSCSVAFFINYWKEGKQRVCRLHIAKNSKKKYKACSRSSTTHSERNQREEEEKKTTSLIKNMNRSQRVY